MWSPPVPFKRLSERHGLTLVELVLALSFFSFLMASVGHLVLASLRVQRSWGQVVRPAQAAEHALSRLSQDLQAAQPFFAIPFRGNLDGNGLVFARLGTVTNADGQPTTEWLRVVYRFAPTGEEVALVREEFLLRDGPSGDRPLRSETLARMAGGEFRFGVLNTDKQLEWPSTWDGETDGIPRLVMLTYTLPMAGGMVPLTMSRVFRNPAGTLPEPEVEQP